MKVVHRTISRIVKAGKNILCEKPLETTVDKINKIERVLESHIKLGCVFQNRENLEYIKLKNYLDSGTFSGKVLLCQSTINWYHSQNHYEDSWRGTIAMDGGAALITKGSILLT